ncbi:MAG: ribonuclease III [Acidobacteria bacterium]|nr:ribonuclease III [Acidobacteriota bacterium]
MSEPTSARESPGTDLSDLEAMLGYSFRDPGLLLRALTHRSYVNEHEGEGLEHNESLEFLGDSVLGFLVSSRVFSRFPGLQEGELSKIKAYLVSAANLLQLAKRLRLGEFVRLSRGEDKTGGRTKRAILVDTYEAVIGAIYLDGGIDAASSLLVRQVEEILDGLDMKQVVNGDFKSVLQEQLHDLGRPEPVYRVVAEIGPDHRKTFIVQVLIHDEVVAEASGRTKKEAQQAAARLALGLIGRDEPPRLTSDRVIK